MKKFKTEDKFYISKNVNSKSLAEIAEYLNCSPADVKKCYEIMKVNGEYDKFRVSKYDDIVKKENNLLSLNDYLFEQLESLNDDKLSDDEFKKEVERSKAVVNVAQTIINNEKIILEASKHFQKQSNQVADILGIGE